MAKAMPPQARPAPAAARQAPKRPENALAPLRIVYYRRMHRQHVYTISVGWSNKDRARPPAGAKPVTLRLLMAGAQVVPSEQVLDPAKPDAKVSFYVTPLARGHMRGERLEVLMDDRKVQEVPLRCKVTSQRTTLLLLFMTFLVPWLLLQYCKHSPLTASPDEVRILLKDNAKALTGPGSVLRLRLAQNVPEMPAFVTDNAPVIGEKLVEFREKIGDFYDWVCQNSDKPLALYIGVALLFLTIVSWRLHGVKRKKLVGKPIPLPAGAGAGGASVPLADGLDEDED